MQSPAAALVALLVDVRFLLGFYKGSISLLQGVQGFCLSGFRFQPGFALLPGTLNGGNFSFQ